MRRVQRCLKSRQCWSQYCCTNDVVVAETDGGKALTLEPTFLTRMAPPIEWRYVEASGAMSVDVTHSSCAANVERVIAVAISASLSVPDKDEATFVRMQTETQVVVRIDLRRGLHVTQFVCEGENGSVLLGTRGETCRKSDIFARVRSEISKCCLVGSEFLELTLTKVMEK